MNTSTVKRIGCAILSAAMLSGISVCMVSAEETTAAAEIHIVYTNDIHGYYQSAADAQIGFSALSRIIQQENADLVLDAGDTFHGQSFATVERGASIAELMSAVGYDAVTLGNHDWSYGADRLKELEEQSAFNMLCANVTDTDGNGFFASDYCIKTVTADDGTELKVGIFGVIDDSFYTSTASQNVENVKFTDDVQKANETAEILRTSENCDIVICLTHNRSAEQFASQTSGIDAIIAGHEHVLKDETCTDADGNSVKVVEAGCFFANVGVLTLTYDKESGVTAAVRKTYAAADTQDLSDPAIDEKISSIELREQNVLSEVIAQSSAEYPYSWEDIRTGEQEIGRIITAAYLDFTGADVAIENAGGIRSGIPEGSVTYSDLISISPYGNVLVEKELTGEQLINAVNYSVNLMKECSDVYAIQKWALANGEDPYQYTWPHNSGAVLTFSGLTAEYDMGKTEGERVSNIKVGGKDIDPDKTYRVVTNNYVAESSCYDGIAEQPITKEYTTCEAVLRSYFESENFEWAADTANLVEKTSAEEPTSASEPSASAQITSASTEPSTANEPSTSVTASASSATSDAATADIPSSSSSPDGSSLQTSGVVVTVVLLLILAVGGAVFTVAQRKKQSK